MEGPHCERCLRKLGLPDNMAWSGVCKWCMLFRNVIITGEPQIGEGVSIGDYSEVNAKGARVIIGAHSDIASFVAINAADSSDRCIGRSDEIKRRDIIIGEHVFIGSHCFIGGGVTIGHNSKVSAGTIIRRPVDIPPYSLVEMADGCALDTSNRFGVDYHPGYYKPRGF